MSALLTVRDLQVSYGRVSALRGANIAVSAGEIATVIGPNGAGKSTMLNALMGLLPYAGRVELNGQPIDHLSTEDRVDEGVCLVPETRELFATMTVEENLLLGAFRRYRRGARNLAPDLEEIYGRLPRLKERRTQFAGTLSGGERQMLALGRVLMARPKVLMLDEPSLGLAPIIVRDIFRIIEDLKLTGVGILLVEQNARAALNVANYGYVLETGDQVLEGPSRQLAAEPRIVQAYLGLSKAKSAMRDDSKACVDKQAS
jgi:branched-chain amino acid transport system ATP-binding protein